MAPPLSLTDVFMRKLDSIHTLDEDDRKAVIACRFRSLT